MSANSSAPRRQYWSVECECASGSEETPSFLQRDLLGLDVHQRVFEPDDVERLVLERQVGCVPVLKANPVGQSHPVGKQCRCPAILLDYIGSDDITIEICQGAGDAENPNEIVMMDEWESAEAFQRFMGESDVKERTGELGVISEPEVYILREIEAKTPERPPA